MKVSLCTTVKGRLHHLEKTLPRNIEWNLDFPGTEFVVVDYNSPDGLQDWMRGHFSREIDCGFLVCYREPGAEFFNAPHAKNIAHGLATGEILASIDADHFTGEDYAAGISDLFTRDSRIVVSYDTGGTLDGTIAIRSADFHRLRGYDELLGEGWGYEDTDFRLRAIGSGLRGVLLKTKREASIPHLEEERIRYMKRRGLSQVEQHVINGAIVAARAPGTLVNPDGYGRAAVCRNFSDEPLSVGWGLR